MRPSKKIFVISSSLLSMVLLLWGVYLISFREPSSPDIDIENIPKESEQEEGLPPSNQDSKIILLTEEGILSPVLSKKTSTIKYYEKESGKAYQIDLDGLNKKTLSNKELSNLVNVKWSPDTSKVISLFNENGEIKFFYYKYSENKGTLLKNNLDTVVWQNDNKILYKYYDQKSKERSLNLADPDGSNWNKLANLDYKYALIAPIPKTGLISFWNKPEGGTESTFQSIPAMGGEKKIILQGKFGADYLWNNEGTQALVSYIFSKNSSQIQLGILTASTGDFREINIPTLVSKCVWSQDNNIIYYALPGSIPEKAVWPDGYDKKSFTTADTFWKINLDSGEKTRLVDLDKINGRFDASQLFLSQDESELFFVNRIDDRLYKIVL